MYGTGAASDDLTRALDIKARVFVPVPPIFWRSNRKKRWMIPGKRLIHLLHHVIFFLFCLFCSFFRYSFWCRSFMFYNSLCFYIVGEGTSSATPMTIEGSTHNADSVAVPRTPEDASFKLIPTPAGRKQHLWHELGTPGYKVRKSHFWWALRFEPHCHVPTWGGIKID